VIYCEEEGSKLLKPGLLYNTQLKTVVEHFELKQLEQRDRVLTVYRIFTGTQRGGGNKYMQTKPLNINTKMCTQHSMQCTGI
jgi:hypothetical protein